MLSKTLVLVVSLSLTLPLNVAAGPACVRRQKQAQACMSTCASKWGWPGATMGNDPWGAVMKPQSGGEQGLENANQQACGAALGGGAGASSSSSSSIATQPTVSAVFASSSATPTTTSTTSSTTTSSSSSSSASAKSFAAKPTTHTTSSSTSSSSSSSTASSSSTPPPPPSTKAPPKTTSSSSSAAAPSSTSSSGGGGGGGSGDANESAYLPLHNSIRAQHGAPAMTWSSDLEAAAQKWANGCQFKHSGGSLGPFGENIASGTADSFDATAAINAWVNQNDPEEKFDPGNPQPSHFTQVVWKASTQLGCANTKCSFGHFHVCEYSPQGNVLGNFQKNVQL